MGVHNKKFIHMKRAGGYRIMKLYLIRNKNDIIKLRSIFNPNLTCKVKRIISIITMCLYIITISRKHFKKLPIVAAHLRSLRSDNSSSKGHPRPIKQELRTVPASN